MRQTRTDPFLIKQRFNRHKRARLRLTLPLTFGVDNLVDLMRVVGILGVVLHHLEAHRQVVEGAAEIGFPSRLVVGELVDFTAGYSPGLTTTKQTGLLKRK